MSERGFFGSLKDKMFRKNVETKKTSAPTDTKSQLATEVAEKDDREQELIDMIVELCEGMQGIEILRAPGFIIEKLKNLGLYIESSDNANKKVVSQRSISDIYTRDDGVMRSSIGLVAFEYDDGTVAYQVETKMG